MILETPAYNTLLNYPHKNEILYDHQFGSKKSHSPYMAITHVTNELYRGNDNKEYTTGIFFRFFKSFWHRPYFAAKTELFGTACASIVVV